MSTITTAEEAYRAILDANNEFDGSCLENYDVRERHQQYLARIKSIVTELNNAAYERGRRDEQENSSYPKYPKMFGPA